MAEQSFFRSLFAAPELSGDELVRVDSTLRIIMALGATCAAAWLVVSALVEPTDLIGVALVSVATFQLVFMLRAMRRGRVVTAAWIAVGTTVLATTLGLALQGIGQATVQGGYLLAVIMAGLLLGAHHAVLVAALCVGCLGVVMGFGDLGMLPEPVVRSRAVSWWMGGLILAFAGGLLALTARRARESSSDAGRSRAALHRSNRELRASRDRYEALAEHAHDLVAELDEGGRFLYLNQAFFPVLGFTPADLVGREMADLSHADTREMSARAFEGLAARGSKPQLFHALHKDGSSRFLENSAARYRTPAGELRTIVISRDVSDRIQSEEHVRQLEESMSRTQRTESLGLLASGIAHDFGNLLTTVVANAEDARLQLDDDHPAKPALDDIAHAGEGAVELVRQLLGYAGQGELEVGPVELSKLANGTARMLRVGSRPEITVQLERGDQALWIHADSLQIKQVLLNLLTNARESIEGAGTITLRTGSSEKGSDFAFLEVSDNGCGMDAETLERLFEPFYTTKSTGRGLGMSTVQGVVRSHQGLIDVSSERGTGTTVRISFPALRVHSSPGKAKTPAGARGELAS